MYLPTALYISTHTCYNGIRKMQDYGKGQMNYGQSKGFFK